MKQTLTKTNKNTLKSWNRTPSNNELITAVPNLTKRDNAPYEDIWITINWICRIGTPGGGTIFVGWTTTTTTTTTTVTTTTTAAAAPTTTTTTTTTAATTITTTTTNSNNNNLTAWSRVILENLTCSQLVQKFPAFKGTQMFITVITSDGHLSLFWGRSIQSIPPHSTSWRSSNNNNTANCNCVFMFPAQLHLTRQTSWISKLFPFSWRLRRPSYMIICGASSGVIHDDQNFL